MAVKRPARPEAPRVDSQESLAGRVTLPKDIFDTVVDALAQALVLDYQQDTDRMVRSPRGRVHDVRGRST